MTGSLCWDRKDFSKRYCLFHAVSIQLRGMASCEGGWVGHRVVMGNLGLTTNPCISSGTTEDLRVGASLVS